MSDMGLSLSDKDILKEVSSIGMGNASTALAQLLNTKITISLPDISLIELKDIYKYFPETDILLGVVLKMLGDIKGKVLYLFGKGDADRIVNLLIKSNLVDAGFSDEDRVSTIKEMANILSGSYMNAMSKFLGITLIPSIPHLAMDNAASIFDLASLSDDEEMQLILIRSKLGIFGGEFQVMGSLVLELNKSELKKLLDKIKEKYPQ